MSSVLSAHSSKFKSMLVTKPVIDLLPPPQALGAWHKPVPHGVLIDAIHEEVERRSFTITREQFALGSKGAALFGVIDFKHVREDRSLSFGFRNATNGTMAIRAVAGSHVFVCDNLCLSGSVFAISRKNTTHLDLTGAMKLGFDKFMQQTEALDVQITRLQETGISDSRAKELVFDILAARIVPLHLFDNIERCYFHPTDEMTDCQPRTLYGLHNAVTRSMRDMTPVRLFHSTLALGRQFGLQQAA